MLGVSGILGASGGDAPQPHQSAATTSGDGGGGGEVGVAGSSTAGLSEEEKLRIEEGDRNSGGNRWPRQETLALLKIRSDMDVVFRDSSLKGPLWEEVSRKLAELGFHRSAKKCKEKFENVYKYHKRTKEGRATKPDGKTYRFFDQLEALESQPPLSLLPPPPRSQAHQAAQSPNPVAVAMPMSMSMSMAMPTSTNIPIVSQVTVPSTANPISVSLNINPTNPFPSNPLPPPPPPQSVPATATTIQNPINLSQSTAIPSSHPNMSSSFASISSSSSTSSDEEPERRGKRKRKWESFFQRLMQEVIERQEEMQKKFLETLERRERDRLAREEAWRVQEMARMNREHDLLVQERSIAAAKEAAVISFLQKVSEQQIPNVPQIQMQMQVQTQENPIPPAAAAAVQQPPPQPQPQQQQPAAVQPPPPTVQPTPHPPLQLQPPIQSSAKSLVNPKTDNGGENLASPSSSRWPKAEVEALISLRTNLDLKYQENGPKGPLWEEISNAMRKIGYNRNPKRCKEKWENINKYFKKVKESKKKRPEDSKTCPYFHQLDALYKEKAKIDNSTNCFNPGGGFAGIKPENPMVPIMVQPEQQWPLQQEHQHRPEEDRDSENIDQNNDDDDDGDEDDDEDEASGYEIVTNKPSSVGMVE